jgi:hypothetical protein
LSTTPPARQDDSGQPRDPARSPDASHADPSPEELPYRIVWNDAVDPRQLSLSIALCVAIGLPAFLVSRAVLAGVLHQPALAGGYALLIGLVGCVLGAAVCARLFPPKRALAEGPETDRAAALAELESLGGTAEEFAALPRDVQGELRALGLAPDAMPVPDAPPASEVLPVPEARS